MPCSYRLLGSFIGSILVLGTITNANTFGKPALQGYDPVSFYQQGGPTQGIAKYERFGMVGFAFYKPGKPGAVSISPGRVRPDSWVIARWSLLPADAYPVIQRFLKYTNKLYVFSDRSALLWQQGRSVMQSRAYNRWLKQEVKARKLRKL